MFTSAIFFDNEQKNLDEYGGVCNICSNITCVKIDETHKPYPIKWGNPDGPDVVSPDNTDLTKYIRNNDFKENTYYKFSKTAFPDGDIYDKLSGIQEKDIDRYYTWKEETEGQLNRAAIFDWDRTITIFEGLIPFRDRLTLADVKQLFIDVYGPQNPALAAEFEKLEKITASDTILYLLGGQKRVDMLRKLFSDCKELNITIIILTNNGNCSSPVFDELLKELLRGIPYIKKCSKYAKGKGIFLQGENNFKTLCPDAAVAAAGPDLKRKKPNNNGASSPPSRKQPRGANVDSVPGGSRTKKRNTKKRNTKKRNTKKRN